MLAECMCVVDGVNLKKRMSFCLFASDTVEDEFEIDNVSGHLNESFIIHHITNHNHNETHLFIPMQANISRKHSTNQFDR